MYKEENLTNKIDDSDFRLQKYYRAHFDYFNPLSFILTYWVVSEKCVFDWW